MFMSDVNGFYEWCVTDLVYQGTFHVNCMLKMLRNISAVP